MRPVFVIDTGSANARSVGTALRRVGLRPRTASTPSEVLEAEHLVLPGVGAFGAAMAQLQAQELVAALRERCARGQLTLAVCVGLQLLARASEEDPEVEGLGLIDAEVGRFRELRRVPHMGWNRVTAPPQAEWIEDGHAYFANSFRLGTEAIARMRKAGWQVATTEYGTPFVAAARRSGLLACQFHPELSGAWGLELLRRWAAASADEEVLPC